MDCLVTAEERRKLIELVSIVPNIEPEQRTLLEEWALLGDVKKITEWNDGQLTPSAPLSFVCSTLLCIQEVRRLQDLVSDFTNCVKETTASLDELIRLSEFQVNDAEQTSDAD